MDLAIRVASSITEKRNEEDKVDRLNYQYTSYVFVFCAVLIMSKQYMGSPITCWTPAEFRPGWVEYTRDYCLIENTYWVPIDDPALPEKEMREQLELPYYQWAQFMLVGLALFYMLPHFVWRSLNWQSGVQVRSIVDMCVKSTGKPAERETMAKKVAAHMHHSFCSSVVQREGYTFMQRISHGQSISLSYFLMKILFIANIVFQLIILHIFLGFNPLLAFQDGWNSDWKQTGLFPRSTMCDFEVRTKGNVQRYSVQCVLSLNMFNEKIFALLFIWLCILLAVTVGNTFNWLFAVYSAGSRKNLAVRMLRSQGISEDSQLTITRKAEAETTEKASSEGGGDGQPLLEQEELSHNVYSDFVSFTPDQTIVVRLIAANAGDIVASSVVRELYFLDQKP